MEYDKHQSISGKWEVLSSSQGTLLNPGTSNSQNIFIIAHQSESILVIIWYSYSQTWGCKESPEGVVNIKIAGPYAGAFDSVGLDRTQETALWTSFQVKVILVLLVWGLRFENRWWCMTSSRPAHWETLAWRINVHHRQNMVERAGTCRQPELASKAGLSLCDLRQVT